jgi:hypothetical protein
MAEVVLSPLAVTALMLSLAIGAGQVHCVHISTVVGQVVAGPGIWRCTSR